MAGAVSTPDPTLLAALSSGVHALLEALPPMHVLRMRAFIVISALALLWMLAVLVLKVLGATWGLIGRAAGILPPLPESGAAAAKKRLLAMGNARDTTPSLIDDLQYSAPSRLGSASNIGSSVGQRADMQTGSGRISSIVGQRADLPTDLILLLKTLARLLRS